MNEEITEILKERGQRYGPFKDHASISQQLKNVLYSARNWSRCSYSQQEALEMILHKIARIVNGDPNYDDSWKDIIGYTELVINEITASKAFEDL